MQKALLTSALFSALAVARPQASRLISRNIITNMEQKASDIEIKYQPWTDYDNDGCYNTAAVQADGTKNKGKGATGTLEGDCRDLHQIENANTYSRARCNNGICAIMYDYYFEKDQLVAWTIGNGPANGHVHDFENVVVFVDQESDKVLYTATSCHSGYGGGEAILGEGSHPYVVYHKDKGETHCWRLANKGDVEEPENPTGDFVSSPLIGYWGWPKDNKAWDAFTSGWGGPLPKIPDSDFADWLQKAKDEAGDVVGDFNPKRDG